MSKQEFADWLGSAGLMKETAHRLLLNGDWIKVDLDFLAGVVEKWSAERATPAAASAGAAGTIDTPSVGTVCLAIENAYVAHTGERLDAGVAWDCAKAARALFGDIEERTAAAVAYWQAIIDYVNRQNAELETELAKLHAERAAIEDKFAALLPGVWYMDQPDGGDVSVLEQVRRMAADAAKWRAGLAQATNGGDLTDAQIVAVLASLGIDSEKSKHGFDVLQVHTTVPGIREIVKAYRAATAPVSAAPVDMAHKQIGLAFALGQEYRNAVCEGRGEDAVLAFREYRLLRGVAPVPTSDQVQAYRDCADLQISPRCCGAWIESCRTARENVAQSLACAPVSAAPTAGFDECVASGMSCDYGPYGFDREQQCRYCGKAETRAPQSAGAPVSAAEEAEDICNCLFEDRVCKLHDCGELAGGQELPAPPGWEVRRDDDGVIVVMKAGVGGVVLDEKYQRENIAASIFAAFLGDVLAMRQPDPAGEWVKRADLAMGQQGDLYTCIGKGGEYELIGTAKPAGTMSLAGRMTVYRDTKSGAMYYREPGDFEFRMELVAAKQAGKEV